MKNLAVLFAMLLAALPCAAQVDFISVEVQFDQEQYLPNEELIATVKIQNASGRTVRLGEDPTWLSFLVEGTEGQFVSPLKMPEVQGAFDLASSHTATKRIDLAPCFALTQRGRFKVVATIRVPAFGNTAFASPPKYFYIGNGTTRWQQAFGVPESIVPPKEDGRPEVRRYVLVETNPGANAKLFVRVATPDDKNIRVVELGPLVSFSKPEPQLDRWSNLHVLYQIGAKAFLYTEVNPEGFVLARERHDYSDSRPMLAINNEGRISVRGGIRRYTNTDIPPVEPDVALAPPGSEQPPLALNPPADTTKDSNKKDKASSSAASKRGSDAKEKKKK